MHAHPERVTQDLMEKMLKVVEREGGLEIGGLHTHPERVTQEIWWKNVEREREQGVRLVMGFCLSCN